MALITFINTGSDKAMTCCNLPISGKKNPKPILLARYRNMHDFIRVQREKQALFSHTYTKDINYKFSAAVSIPVITTQNRKFSVYFSTTWQTYLQKMNQFAK